MGDVHPTYVSAATGEILIPKSEIKAEVEKWTAVTMTKAITRLAGYITLKKGEMCPLCHGCVADGRKGTWIEIGETEADR